MEGAEAIRSFWLAGVERYGLQELQIIAERIIGNDARANKKK